MQEVRLVTEQRETLAEEAAAAKRELREARAEWDLQRAALPTPPLSKNTVRRHPGETICLICLVRHAQLMPA